MLQSKDINFVGYTYKNYEMVDANAIPGFGMLISLSLSHSLSLSISLSLSCSHINVCMYASLSMQVCLYN